MKKEQLNRLENFLFRLLVHFHSLSAANIKDAMRNQDAKLQLSKPTDSGILQVCAHCTTCETGLRLPPHADRHYDQHQGNSQKESIHWHEQRQLQLTRWRQKTARLLKSTNNIIIM
jgi:hypothetical protein